MGSIFRIARAEFIKIFKRPTVYIMAFVLAGIIGGSLFLFNPIKKENTFVDMVGTSTTATISVLNDKFLNDVSYKSTYDSYSSDANNEISFFKNITQRKLDLTEAYNNLNTSLNKFMNDISENEVDEFFTNFQKFNSTFKNDDVVTDISTSDQPQFVKDYYTSEIYTSIRNDLDTLKASLENLNAQGTEKLIAYFKSTESNNFSNASNLILRAYNTGYNPSVSFLESYITKITNTQSNYIALVGAGSVSTGSANTARLQLKREVESFKNYVENIVEYDKHTFAVIDNTNYTTFKNNIDSFINALNIKEGSETNLATHQTIINKLQSNNYVTSISQVIKDIMLLSSDMELLDSLTKTYDEMQTRITAQLEVINEYATSKSTSKDINVLNTYNTYVTRYKEMNVSLKNYVYYSILNDLVKDFSNSEVQNFYGKEFNGVYNEYEINEKIVKNNYYIKNDIYSYELDNVFSFNTNSGSETSAYDFMYFALKISTLVIIVFSIFMAANIFASEHDSGTIKLLLMRPFKRHKIVSGKLLATLFFSTIFLLFSTLISFIIGACVYTLPSTPILVVFNASNAFKIHPALLMIIYVFFTLLEIIFYCILSSALCTLFKSYAGAITISFVTYFITIAMNIGFGNSLWYSYSPFVNINLFKFFGNGFITNQNSVLSSFFSTPMLGNMDYFVSLGITAGLMAFLLAITYVIFKRRDY